jgi:hypothetical protein
MALQSWRRIGLSLTGAVSLALLSACATSSLPSDDPAAEKAGEALDASVTDATLASGAEEGVEPATEPGGGAEGAASETETAGVEDADEPVRVPESDNARIVAETSGTDAGADSGAPPSIGSFAVYATESIELNSGALITGCNVGVEGTAGPFLSGGVAAYFNSGGEIATSETLYAVSVYLNSGATIGPVETNSLTNQHGSYGAESPFPHSMPAPPALPSATAGTTAITLTSGAGQPRPRRAGSSATSGFTMEWTIRSSTTTSVGTDSSTKWTF